METALATRSQELPMELSVNDLMAQVRKIQEVMKQCMKEGEHYGVIPGTNKPTLLKPGAEKLNLVFRFDPQYESSDHYDGDHLTIKSKCTLYHIPTQLRIGSGEGSCSTKESKYAYRNAQLACPECGKETILKSKNAGEGFFCWRKKGGCGATFPDDQFKGVALGKVANDNLADQYNTILKMANKRSLIAAVLNATAASDIFTQDLEDMQENGQSFGGNGHGDRPIRQQDHPDLLRKQTEKQTNYVQHLGAAIMEFCNHDRKAAAEILKDLTGHDSLKNVTQTDAKAAQIVFERKYLGAAEGREPGSDDR